MDCPVENFCMRELIWLTFTFFYCTRFLGAAAVSRAEERWKHVATSNLHYLARKARPNMQVLSDAIKTMNHGRRMEVYFKSIRNATLGRPRFSRNVVIIGSAGGALAVMASRAGADRVYVCEKARIHPALFGTSRYGLLQL